MEEKVFAVSEINKIIKRIFDSEEMLHGILLSGEVTNFKISGNHAYFNIKDDEAQIFCTFFNIRFAQNTVVPKNGDKVIVRGTPDYYVKGGSLSFKVTKIQPEGLGALYVKFLELKERLQKEGLFNEDHKIPVPTSPKRIGVVTSKTGAVIKDIINVATRRNPYVDIVLFPVKVQGEGADMEIARGIEKLDSLNLTEVIIVARGGGSMEDLQPFNTEIVARAVYACQTPIVSAVGHETDFSLCDFAADLRAPTPSAAAELTTVDLIREAENFVSTAKLMRNKAINVTNKKTDELSHEIDKLKFLGGGAVDKAKAKVTAYLTETLNLLRTRFIEKQNALKINMSKIDNLNPLKMLDKGFAKVSVRGKTVKSVADVAKGDTLETYVLGGSIQSKIENIKEKKL